MASVTTSSDIIRAIRGRHYSGALLTEVLMADEAMINRLALNRLERYGPKQAYLNFLQEVQDGRPLAPATEVGARAITERRIDGLLYAEQKLTAIEVKVSLADFRRETPEKRRCWEEVTHRFVYATPQGLLRIEDIPPHCGLWEIDPRGRVTVVKKARINKNPLPLPQQVVVSLMYRAQKAERM